MSKLPDGFIVTTHVTGRGHDLWRKQADGTANYVSWHEHLIDAVEFAIEMDRYGYFASSIELFESEAQ